MSALLVASVGCDREGASRSAAPIAIVLDTSRGVDSARVVASGLSAPALRAMRALSADSLATVAAAMLQLYVDDTVANLSGRAVASRFVVTDSTLELRPRFPLDAGRRYMATLNHESSVTTRFALPAPDRTPRTYVSAVYPSGPTVPENLLRVYIEFSAPMSRTAGLPHISLQDERGTIVRDAFLPLDADFWNAERTRYTAFLDPGRVKRGILPNEQMGRAIRAGRRYAIVIDSSWRDERGALLTSTYRHAFGVTAPDERVVDIAAWRVDAPRAGTMDTLIVRFPKALDRGLLARALGVETANGTAVQGEVAIGDHELLWRFAPRVAWANEHYQLFVLSMLEDPAGNRLDHPFEVDMFDRVDKAAPPERRVVPFTVR